MMSETVQSMEFKPVQLPPLSLFWFARRNPLSEKYRHSHVGNILDTNEMIDFFLGRAEDSSVKT